MRTRHTRAVLIFLASTATAALAQTPGGPSDLPELPDRSQPPMSRSDEHRIVGKVLNIDATTGLAKLAAEEGEVMVQPPPQLLRAMRVGDTVSVPRSAAEGASASPRQSPRR
jgi:hypothetical protein